jgi:hypothetical protein
LEVTDPANLREKFPKFFWNPRYPEFFSSILSDLTKLKFPLRKKLAPATVLDGIEWAEQTLPTGWADPVHLKQHIYSKMALNLIEKVAAASNTTSSQKRKRSEWSEDASSSQGRQVTSGRGAGNRGGYSTHSPTRLITPLGATNQLVASTASTTRGPPQGAEVPIPAKGMLEAEVMPASKVAATTGEDSLAEAGDGHGAAGSESSPQQVVVHIRNISFLYPDLKLAITLPK